MTLEQLLERHREEGLPATYAELSEVQRQHDKQIAELKKLITPARHPSINIKEQ